MSAERRATCLRGDQTLRRNTWGIINIQLAKKECFNLAIIVEYMKYNVFFHHREMMKEALTQVLQQVTEKKQKKNNNNRNLNQTSSFTHFHHGELLCINRICTQSAPKQICSCFMHAPHLFVCSYY